MGKSKNGFDLTKFISDKKKLVKEHRKSPDNKNKNKNGPQLSSDNLEKSTSRLEMNIKEHFKESF